MAPSDPDYIDMLLLLRTKRDALDGIKPMQADAGNERQ
jgi:hypothetical protein